MKRSLNLADYLPYLVNRVGTIIAEQFGAEALAPYGLSIAMWRVLAALASSGGQRQIDLAELTSIDASTLSRIVTRLMRLGLVTRARSTNSNREVMVSLSPKGNALAARLIPLAEAIEVDAGTGLSPEELATLKRSLRRIYANMKSRPAADSGNSKQMESKQRAARTSEPPDQRSLEAGAGRAVLEHRNRRRLVREA